MSARVLVFAKAPVPGRVKTRLARRLGRRAAAGLYRGMLAQTVAMAAEARVAPVELWVTPRRHPALDAMARRHGLVQRVQPPGDLGQRMERASRYVLGRGGPVVIIGGDCTGLTARHLAAAMAALAAGRDAVFAPAPDGGYTLVGLARPAPALFRAVPWGTSAVLAETLQRVRRARLDVALLSAADDLDNLADLRRYRRQRGTALLWRGPG
ncbi:TIGR04282 family arsenosugar biosynthesis glycosyltransferase [Sediminicurvatus halobius]|uniref:Glycosyltransferase n=1 Tax=Sediminicurvatus halobius TaxID=2182432 RepID=A0A2U2N4K6_9GAMM|nr:TIGR04282 family arsenosugar biosynthesis glycosyltransferase [Spiribacter halobius]PWG64040.1 hypothetical protein DEM34_05935 [Spiribacter halobius]UEX76905.1 TIGR04282 family arsenosugar biosynthesis glycosyltransferase [Spiribacter halobius]